jgi:mRNA-degrading endonuclease toxin of MazEF toxin-antitoxin module
VPTSARPGEVWFAELGMVEKSRPVLVLAMPDANDANDARALVVVAPLTSQIRNMRGEVPLGKPAWLPKVSAVNVQGLASFDRHKLIRRMGALTVAHYEGVKVALRDLLHL